MKVLKFGGSSVANADNINKVSDIIQQKISTDKIVVVVSALGGVTNLLLEAGVAASKGDENYKDLVQSITNRHLQVVKDLFPISSQSKTLSYVMQRCNEIEDICNGIFLLNEFSPKTNDRIISYGEIISSQILSDYLTSIQIKNVRVDIQKIILTDSHFTKAVVDFSATNKNLEIFFSSHEENLFIVPGFIAKDIEGNVTTLGRGGSDYTAAIIGSALNASSVEIWTDVSGMMTADPRLVNTAKSVSEISYQEAMELSHFGAKVIYPPTIQPVMNKQIPVWIKNTFAPNDEGTVIQSETKTNGLIRGISSINNIALLSLEGSGMVGIPGFSKRLFETLAAKEINVILITQSSSEHSICVGIEEINADKAKKEIDKAFAYEIQIGKVEPVIVERELAIIALVGDKMKNHAGTSGKMFGVIGRNGINVRAIAQGSSERNISAVIATKDVKKTINVLHEEFFENSYKQVNLFITGTGNVGSKLLSQLHQQQKYLLENLKLQVRVIGLANSRKMFFNDDGIDLNNWKDELNKGTPTKIEEFIQTIQTKNLRNSVFADVTANEQIASQYNSLLQKSISVVACNKIACSSPYSYYKQLKNSAREFNASLLFETNVGAGLPVIGTLNDLLSSGDSIN